MGKKKIIADASPLIAFSHIDKLSLLVKLFETVIIPKAVADECLAEMHRPGALAIQKVIKNKMIKIQSDPFASNLEDLTELLGSGEAAAIRLAYDLKYPLIIDDKLGRTIAAKLQIKIIGTAGILLLAKQKKIIKAIYPLIQQLKKENYYFSDDLIKTVLKMAGENE